jgi:non-specific serine/threonine protein kinase
MGSARIKDAARLYEYDLIITSYQTMSRDIGLFASMDFHYLILDEAQYIKNSASQTFKAVRSIHAGTRLSLTGTPVENRSHELWSQMDFLNPGLLGSSQDFQNRFARAIEVNKDLKAAETLRKKTSPFILRRKKEDVAPELPDKEEIIFYTEMGPGQWKLYDSIRKQYRSNLKKTLVKNSVGGSLFEILEGLLRLRQAALMPSLIDKKFTRVESCKFEALKEMVSEIISEDHKVLIFSQFVKVLDQLREHFDEKKVDYSYIDGSTRKRAEEIKRFQEDEKRKLFLLSLKAGGVGINLTAADYVIIFDPWWNPAVEAQAIDRSHRIGQTRRVIAYKYIVKNTIEEKMLELQNKKKKLVDDIISDESTLLTSLSRDEIMDLFG